MCSHAILKPEEVMVITNATKDKRFANNPLVTQEPCLRFYAGAPLVTAEGYALGTLCVVGREPKEITPEQQCALAALSRQVVSQLELHKRTKLLQQQVELNDKKTEQLETTIDQLQQTQTNLITSEKMVTLGHLVRGIAHEINNPVNFISGNLSHLNGYTDDLLTVLDLYEKQKTVDPNSKHAEILEEIDLDYLRQDLPHLFKSMSAGTQRIKRIVESLKLFSRLDEKGLKNIDVNSSLDAITNLLKIQLDEQGLSINICTEYAAGLPLVTCDSSKINQALMAIVQNAIDALKQGVGYSHQRDNTPTITIRTALVDGKQMHILISDNGFGIPAPAVDKIFEPFFTTKPVGQGTGLGLAISRQIINQHNGKISVISREGLGTTFCVTLPVYIDHDCRDLT